MPNGLSQLAQRLAHVLTEARSSPRNQNMGTAHSSAGPEASRFSQVTAGLQVLFWSSVGKMLLQWTHA